MQLNVRTLRKPTALVVAALMGGFIAIAPVLAGNGPALAATNIVAKPASIPTTVLADAIVPSLGTYRDLGPVSSSKPMNVAITLHHDDAAVAAFEASLNNPASANYQRWLTARPVPGSVRCPGGACWDGTSLRDPVRDAVYNPSGLGDVTLVSGTAAQVERTFNVGLHRFLDDHGREFYANTDAPTVPANVGVAGVLGLQTLVMMHRPPGITKGQGQCVGGVCTGLLGPTALWSVYDQPSANFGQGETIGIIGEGRTDDVIRALRRFEKTRGLPNVPVQVYWTDPGAKTDDAGRIEWELDTRGFDGYGA